uniref:Plasmid stabilization system protein ParE n=1 Tax=Candidatus Kentrum sp. FM TaxID=2126340 RepID=A0A450RXH3_9GAMM|nr:MAG: Plasmid stabilization system protein ParE [Candidatus Kentron sp. FM]VFJ43851.1 MAG: Plasmid stabilization system protein ParE [Candidatus Kentron sp. FM]VFK05773.1 MAG: Plasmid stabilization system protein ParE [Candidatus Kentron sp. FM]
MAVEILITGPARSDIEQIWWRGCEQYNRRVADDYKRLIKQAIQDLSEEPFKSGTLAVGARNDGLRRYRLEHSRKKAGVSIRKPAHTIFYYAIEGKAIVISRVIREARAFVISEIEPPP